MRNQEKGQQQIYLEKTKLGSFAKLIAKKHAMTMRDNVLQQIHFITLRAILKICVVHTH